MSEKIVSMNKFEERIKGWLFFMPSFEKARNLGVNSVLLSEQIFCSHSAFSSCFCKFFARAVSAFKLH